MELSEKIIRICESYVQNNVFQTHKLSGPKPTTFLKCQLMAVLYLNFFTTTLAFAIVQEEQ